MKHLTKLSTIFRRHAAPRLKQATPVLLCFGLAALRCEAAQSPIAQWFTDMSAEATGTWAIAGTVIGMVLGLLRIKFGGHEMKGKAVGLFVTSFFLLSVQGIVNYLQSE